MYEDACVAAVWSSKTFLKNLSSSRFTDGEAMARVTMARREMMVERIVVEEEGWVVEYCRVMLMSSDYTSLQCTSFIRVL